LANAKLGAVHGFAAPIGGQFVAPHGAVCARLLPLVMQANVAALRARAPHSPLLQRYEEIAQLLTGSASAGIEDGVAFVAELAHDLAIPPLSSYGMTADQIPGLVAKAAVASSTKGNPIVLTTAELTQVLERAL
jgi:alcohol dehydrogenase class IV